MNKLARFLVLLFFTALPWQAGHAATSLEVSPIRIVLTKDGNVAAMTVRNRGGEDAVVQLRMTKWTQGDGKDQYADSGDLFACPPLFTVKAGEEQVVRVALVEQHLNWGSEGTYRLFIQEVPPAPDEGAANQIQFAVRISIPIFLTPQGTAPQPPLSWHIEQRDGLWATVKNNGNLHALVTGVQLAGADGIFFKAAAHQYVLPGATMSWRLDSAAPFTGTLPDSFGLVAATDQGSYQDTLPATE